ncbi:Crp/Fnr family transcriptional regulator [Sphingobium sp.]|uniref:Crp/Fnr family transcriptional regulator n=1 Tax=Sphingobium sp. TaxID=1912891 RepID=UPI0028BE2BC8|nr:Crp/Fnr family transcriptional regulator [Sphingobium sp.]
MIEEGFARRVLVARQSEGRKMLGVDNAIEFASDSHAEAWRSSYLASQLPYIAKKLLPESRMERMDANSVIAGKEGRLFVVLEGSLRVYQRSTGGRELVFNYLVPGDTIGLALSVAPKLFDALEAKIFAITPAIILHLPYKMFLGLVENDLLAVRSIAEEVIRLLLCGHIMLAKSLSLPVKGRIALSLLELSMREQGIPVIRSTQQEIANAAGTVRRVVVRTMGEFKESGILERKSGAWIITDELELFKISEHARNSSAEPH